MTGGIESLFSSALSPTINKKKWEKVKVKGIHGTLVISTLWVVCVCVHTKKNNYSQHFIYFHPRFTKTTYKLTSKKCNAKGSCIYGEKNDQLC